MPSALRSVPLSFDTVDWRFTSRGRFLLVEDPRGLRQIFHPWQPSSDGDFGALTARVRVPADWRGPIYLSAYASDTYVAEGWEQVKPTWTHTYAACHQMVGHRFKQALVDGQVVWERDVGDPETDTYVGVDLSPWVSPGQEFELTLRVLDRVGTTTRLAGDEFRLGIWSWQGLADPQAADKLYTRVFWGDVALGEGGAVPWESNPARPALVLHPIGRDPALPASRAEGHLTLDAPAGLPTDGFPVTWGVPFAQGELPDPERVALAGPDGAPLPLQTEVLQRWPDGSVHWLLLDFSAPGGAAGASLGLAYGSRVTPAPRMPGLTVEAVDSSVTVDTGALRFAIRRGREALLEDVVLVGDDEPLGRRLAAQVTVRDGWARTRYAAIGDRIKVEAAGPERATVLIDGRLRADDRVFGRFTLRVHAYRQRSYLRLFYRIWNDTDLPAQLVEELFVRLATSLTDGEASLGDQALTTGPAEVDRLLVRQHRHDAYEVFSGDDRRRGSGGHWEQPITLMAQDEGVTGMVRNFAQLYPKRMWAGSGGQVVFDLFTRTQENEQYVMTRGEALRHELLLYFHRGRPEPAVSAAFDRPPILSSPGWYAKHQALGRGAPLVPEAFPELCRWMLEPWTPDPNCTVPLGLRNWPDQYSDSIYNAYRGTWSNLYQEVDYGALLLALFSGRRAWFDYAEAYQRHFMDLDVCHHHPDSTYVGAAYGIAPDHTGSEPYALNAPLAGLFLLHYLTGDPDARETAVGIAGWLRARHLGVGAGSGRAVGWPLRSAVIAYENTGEPRYLEAARGLAEYALASLEPRRGFFSEPPATWQYRGGSPGMNAILAAGLMRYWRATGDPRVGRACADIAYNMAYGWMSPTEPGLVLGVDPLQQVHVTGYALQDVAPLFWGYELTGDQRLLAKGMEMMQASILAEDQRGAAFGLSRYWEMQDVLYYYGLGRQLGLDRIPARATRPATAE